MLLRALLFVIVVSQDGGGARLVNSLLRPNVAAARSNSVLGVVESLKNGAWVKFICGASNQDLPLIRNLCLLYTLAGVDCIDLSADPAVVMSAEEGVTRALQLMSAEEGATRALQQQQQQHRRPLLMISVNDNEDLHFRKAVFDPTHCPKDCPRPCERVCPAWAIGPRPLSSSSSSSTAGVIAERCYGCGRCIPTCPLGIIEGVSYTVDRKTVSNMFNSGIVDAIEIHTQHGQGAAFAQLWDEIGHSVLSRAAVVAVSFPDMKNETLPYLNELQGIIAQHPAWSTFTGVQIWQTDGRPMSGDVGKGMAHASTNFARRILDELSATDPGKLQPAVERTINLNGGKHFLQLAGGTNDYSPPLAKSQGLIGAMGFGGFAFGGYARRDIGTVLRSLEDAKPGCLIEDHPSEFHSCLEFSRNLVHLVKQRK
jgi:Fe-S-cluster-containing hydrogenase component 2